MLIISTIQEIIEFSNPQAPSSVPGLVV